jgi:hypothetical protein
MRGGRRELRLSKILAVATERLPYFEKRSKDRSRQKLLRHQPFQAVLHQSKLRCRRGHTLSEPATEAAWLSQHDLRALLTQPAFDIG